MHKYVLINGERLTPETKITKEIKDLPWIWTAATRRVANVDIPHRAEGNPVRWFFEQYVRPLEPKERLLRQKDRSSLDVNPWHYDALLPVLMRQETIDSVDHDVAVIEPEAQFGDPASEADLADLVETLMDAYTRQPFQTWDQYHDAMKDTFAGVLPRDQLNALAHIGITLTGEKRYVV